MPEKVEDLIFLEPFFSEFQSWLRWLRPLNRLLLAAARFTDRIGLRRHSFSYQPDYVALSKYPIFVQPFFDILWQDLTNYLDKCLDILTYELPAQVNTPTLMIFSPKGFTRDPGAKKRLQEVFTRSRLLEMGDGTHNAITMGAVPVATAVREALKTAKQST